MSVFLKTALFGIIVIAAFTLFSVYYIPDLKPAPPPKETKADITTMDVEEITALGRYVYNVKGSCSRCHGSAGSRAPEIRDIAITSAGRINDTAYRGRARTAVEYIYESMQYPSVYVVEGYGKKGTGDTESPMPAASSRAVKLTETEMRAVIVYLQDISGVEPTPFFELPEVIVSEETSQKDGKVMGEATDER